MSKFIPLTWDLTKERLTLGGALVLRQEGELIARDSRATGLRIHLRASSEVLSAAEDLAEHAFRTSAWPVELTRVAPPPDAWPSAEQRDGSTFSYFSFSRLLQWYEARAEAPRLSWCHECRLQSMACRATFPGRLVCVHIRSDRWADADTAVSNQEAWRTFLQAKRRPGSLDFIFVGNDPIRPEWLGELDLPHAADLGLQLGAQLCLITLADAFLGTASGMCTPANLSDVPYVIFKDPTEHAAEMQRELGDFDRFSFATAQQRLWRCKVSTQRLNDALSLVIT